MATFPLDVVTEFGVPSLNLLDRDSANLAGTIGSWTGSGTPAPVLTPGTAPDGSPALEVTWNGSGTFPQAQVSKVLTASVPYTVSLEVYVPAGGPDVRLVGSSTTGALTPTKNAWQPLSLTFTQGASTTVTIAVRGSGSPAGSKVYVRKPMLVYGSVAKPFTSGKNGWCDVTGSVFQRDPITISRGRSDEASNVDPSKCNLTLDNRTGDYSPRNPNGSYFGALGRNTPMRVIHAAGLANYLRLAGNDKSYVTTPDAATLDTAGDLDVRMELEPQSWRPPTLVTLARKADTDTQMSWFLFLTTAGNLVFAWSSDGAGTGYKTRTATVPVPANSGRIAVRAVLDVDNGAAGHDVIFYTGASITATWAQLGSTVTTAGTTSVFASTSSVLLGLQLQAKVYAFELRTSIAGAAVASPTFTLMDSGMTSLTDAQGLVWTPIGNAVAANPNARFHGALSTLPPRWDLSGKDVYTPVQADGIMRRLGQGASALKSTLYRGLTRSSDVVAYWPFEDGADSTALASALSGHPPMTINPTVGTAVTLASYDGFKCSEPLPVGSGAIFAADVPDYPLAIPTNVQVRFLMFVPAGGVPADGPALRLFTSGTAGRWDLKVNTGGSMSLITYDTNGNQINDSGAIAFGVNGKLLRVSLELSRVGTAVTYNMVTLQVGQTNGSSWAGSIASQSLGKATRVVANPARYTDVVYGHVSVHNQITSIFDLGSELNAYTGETAAARIMRLCRDESVPAALVGDATDSVELGPQLPKTLLELLAEAADADLGILHEPREFLGLAYRTRSSLYAQAAAVAASYTDLRSIEPVEDDQSTRNDVTVERVGGASARAERTTGALSTAPPPAGVGRYDEKVPVNVALDSVLPDHAGWRLLLGTVDEARYPVVGVNLVNYGANPTLAAAAEALNIGDRVTISNPPAWLPPDDISQLVQGLTEVLKRFEWTIDVNCSPSSPWDAVGRYDTASGVGEARYSSDGSTLSAAATTTATTITVATPSGPLWTGADQPFDIYVAGERMRVTAVSGAASPQTFTVTRSVNGIVKAHVAGEEVRLFHPTVWAL